MKGMIATTCVVLLLATASPAFAHPGGLDKHGCHTNRSTGEYHCHRGSAPAVPRSELRPAPARSDAAPRPSQGGAYRNCTEARAAGAAPVRRGDPGYGSHLDRDNDGVGCEG